MLHALIVGLVVATAQACPFPPVITLEGYSPVYIRCEQPYIELGASANSECDGDLSAFVTVNNSSVNTNVPGTYYVVYTVTDNAGAATTATREVIVLDEFTLVPTGANRIETVVGYGRVYVTEWECNTPYDDPGAVAFDGCDYDLSNQIQVTGVSNVLPGHLTQSLTDAHIITYTVQNSRGQSRTAYRAVFIVDRRPPAIALRGDGDATLNWLDWNNDPQPVWWGSARAAWMAYPWNPANGPKPELPMWWWVREEWNPTEEKPPLFWHCNKPNYEDPGVVSVMDHCEGPLNVDDVILILTRYYTEDNTEVFQYIGRMGDIDLRPPPRLSPIGGNWLGYRAYYLIRDKSGNPSVMNFAPGSGWPTLRSRYIAPIYNISIIGGSGTTQVGCHEPFNPLTQVRAVDLCQGDITSQLVVTGNVDTSVPGTYHIQYSIRNIWGTANLSERIVEIVDRERPVISLLTPSSKVAEQEDDKLSDPVFTQIPWCALRDNGIGWWEENTPDSFFALFPGRGWVVSDNCDLGPTLTNRVELRGGGLIRSALELLPGVRNQGIDPVYAESLFTGYELLHTVTDENLNVSDTALRIIQIVPTIPEIQLVGSERIVRECVGGSYLDTFITILDQPVMQGVEGCRTDANVDPWLFTVTIVSDNPAIPPIQTQARDYLIDTSLAATHTITYEVTNAIGRVAQPRTRTVVVQDTEGPVVTFIPKDDDLALEPYLEWSPGQAFIPANLYDVLAQDACDGAVPAQIADRDGMDFSSPQVGVYYVRYRATDSTGNTGDAILQVRVGTPDAQEGEDERRPTIRLIGAATITLECSDPYIDLGAVATDEVDGNLTASIVVTGTPDVWRPGSYTVEYSVLNSVLNRASVSRTVIVQDTVPPLVTLRGAPSMSVVLGEPFTDQGAVATDECQGSITVDVTGRVNVNEEGVYVLTYRATDRAGNVSDPITRSVRVVDPKTDGREGEQEGESPGEGEGEGGGGDETGCLDCAGCSGDKSAVDSFHRFLGDYLLVGLSLLALLAWSRPKR